MIFGENLLALLVLALGGALAVGNLLALLRPRPLDGDDDTSLAKAPLGRSVLMIAIGAIAAVWALASLISGGDEADLEGAYSDEAGIRGVPTQPTS